MRQPPVEWAGTREPFNAPQTIPPAPMTLPGVARKGRLSSPGAGAIVEVRTDHAYATVTDTAVAVTTASAKFLDSPTGLRNLLMLRNSSATATVFIGFGRDATTQSTLQIAAGQTVIFDTVVPQDDLYVIGDAAGSISFAYSVIAEY